MLDITDLKKGELYLITNLINDKQYIGQAQKYIGKNNQTWGTEGRWKSHIREAKNLYDKNNCILLNNSINKYGIDKFKVEKICDCLLTDIDELEQLFIVKYNTLHPNGFNLKTGGAKGKDSDITREKKSLAKTGIRRKKKERLYPEDADLPKYIVAKRAKGIIINYSINNFPIGNKKYICKTFGISNNNKEVVLQKAIEELDKLKKEYSYIETKEITPTITKEKKEIEKLPDYIFPIIEDTYLKGYYVEGLVTPKGDLIKKKDFVNCQTNKWNLDQAKKYIEYIEQLKTNKITVKNWSNIDVPGKRGKNIENIELPKYINIAKTKGKSVGYCINGLIIKDENGNKKKYFKKITKSNMTMTEKYKMCINHLNEMKEKHKNDFDDVSS